MNSYFEIPKLGELYIDKVLFDSSYPILFTLSDRNNNIYICVCHHHDSDCSKWLISRTTPSEVIALLNNKLSMRQIFLSHADVRYSITKDNQGCIIEENVESDWEQNSKTLPDDEYMDADEGEFSDIIEHYLENTNDSLDYAYNTLSESERLIVKKYVLSKAGLLTPLGA